MEIERDVPPEIKREILLSQCVEKGWELYMHQFGKIKGTQAGYLQEELNNRTPFLKRFISSWQAKLMSDVKRWQQIEPRLTSETDARVAVMTNNRAYFQVARVLDKEDNIPLGYVRTMEGLRALMPWNRTGINPITINQVTIEDLEQAANYIYSKLPNKK